MTKQNEVIEFVALMTREFPGTADLAGKLAELLRAARAHGRLQEQACNEQVPDGHDAKCEQRIRTICTAIHPECKPVFSGDPRGATVKLVLPSGKTNDWGGTGICVPQ